MWSSSKGNDNNDNSNTERSTTIPQQINLTPLADIEVDSRSMMSDARDRFSDFFDNTRVGMWNLGDAFGFGGSPFFGDNTVLPRLSQYSRCLEQGGRSVWAEDGFWRCLFKGQQLPPGLTHEFKDYTGFLDYQRDLVKQRIEQRKTADADRQLAGRQNQGDVALSKSNDALSVFPGGDRPRLISEDEAKGKQVVSQNFSSETVTLDDGSSQTRTREVRYFDDGTALVKNSNDISKDAPKGWFWK